MSMMTNTKKKNRWQAVALVALVLAGSVAVPQAADAATKKQVNCTSYQASACKVTTKANGVIRFRVVADIERSKTMPYTVKTSSGRLLCSGKIGSRQTRTCSFNYSGKVTVRVNAPAWSFPSIVAY